MKIPSAVTMQDFEYFKIGRFNFSNAQVSGDLGLALVYGYNPGHYNYLSSYAPFSAHYVVGSPVNPPSGWGDGPRCGYLLSRPEAKGDFYAPAPIPTDGQWHCWETRVKLNTTGHSDGIIQFWLDGTLIKSITNACFGANDNSVFTAAPGVGMGNSDSQGFQNSWQAIEFDDYVISTTYIGPVGNPPLNDPTPSPPTGLKIKQ